MKTIRVLGQTLSSQAVKSLNTYVSVVLSLRKPKSVYEIQSFLGLVNYVGIANLATLAEPLGKLLNLKL